MDALLSAQPELKFLTEIPKVMAQCNLTGRVLLFGSRARGAHKRRSDVDILFQGERGEKWAHFLEWAEDRAPTLLIVDLVHEADASPEFLQNILKEAIVLYER